MQPGKYDLSLYRGDTYSWTFRLWSDAAKTVPLDLTTAAAHAEIRDSPGGSDVMSLDCLIIDPGMVQVQVRADDWADAPLGGVWDLELHWADGRVRTVLAGEVTVTPDVTHSTATVAPFSVHVEEVEVVTRLPVALVRSVT